jgi:hypothetical protein
MIGLCLVVVHASITGDTKSVCKLQKHALLYKLCILLVRIYYRVYGGQQKQAIFLSIYSAAWTIFFSFLECSFLVSVLVLVLGVVR